MLQQFLCNDAGVEVIDYPLLVYEVSGWDAIQAKGFLNLRCFIQPDREIYSIPCYEIFHFFFGIVYSDTQKYHSFWPIFMGNFYQDGHFFPAWQTPGSEEIDQNGFPFMVTELEIIAVNKGERKIGGRFLGLQ